MQAETRRRRGEAGNMPATYIVGYDGSEPSKRAVDWAVRHAKAMDAKVVLATVVPRSIKDSFFSTMLLPHIDLSKVVPSGTFEASANARLEEAAKATGLAGGQVETRVLQGEAWAALVALAGETRPDALVIGEKSYEKVEAFHLGASAERIVRHAPCTVVVVR